MMTSVYRAVALIALCFASSIPAHSAVAQNIGEGDGTGDVPDGCNSCYSPEDEILGRDIPGRRPGGDSVPLQPEVDPATGEPITAPAPPPSHAEIVQTVCPTAPTPAIGHSPHEYGITGWETWIWDDTAPTAITTTSSIRGYAVTCTLTPTTWTVDTGDPHAEQFGHPRTYTATQPGQDAESTPIRHLYERKGTYPITMTVTWQRTTTAGQDTLTRTTTRDHQVKEVRAGMTTPDS